MSATPAEFAVYQFFVGGACERAVAAPLKAKAAVKLARMLTHTLGARIGSTCRIIITNGGDHTVFEWRYGEGIVLPALEDARR